MFNELLDRYPALEVCKEEIKNAAEAIIRCYENGGKVMLCGNGGSCFYSKKYKCRKGSNN